MREQKKDKICLHETIRITWIPEKKIEKVYQSKDGLIIWDLICIKIDYFDTKSKSYDKEAYLAITNYGLKICINIPNEIREKCNTIYTTKEKNLNFPTKKLENDNYAITIILTEDIKNLNKKRISLEKRQKILEPVTIFLDNRGNIINKFRIIDFKYNKFIEKCEDYISDMKVGDLTEIVGELGSVSAVFLMTKLNKLLKRNFIKRSKANE